ncbi:hypothetical protein [Actinocrispum sp. NPDC049592]|uniref:hypothetical protein n=1 Tax=Actinocrispum sp. NPDC049592 TaxID=3154835 RepID=UPI003426BEA5
MVLAISFVEAPLKFRAPGVTVPLGLGIGRIVFRALNTIEAVLALVIVVTLITAAPPVDVLIPLCAAILMLVIQVALVRPRLSRRSDRVLAGEDAPRSHAHIAYVALEGVKVVALLVGGVLLLV